MTTTYVNTRWAINYWQLRYDIASFASRNSLKYMEIDELIGTSNLVSALCSPGSRYGTRDKNGHIMHLSMRNFLSLCDLLEVNPQIYVTTE